MFWGDHCLQSSEGVQQGDPLGHLLFCLTIHKLTSQLQSKLSLFYLDDGTLGGAAEQVLHDLQSVEQGAEELSLSLNHSKSEVISEDPTARNVLLSSFPNLQVTDPASAMLLGSPIGNCNGISSSIREKSESLKILGNRICYLHTQDALLLLCHFLAIPELLYTLRQLPLFFLRSFRCMMTY